jgi:hypothetical protein
MHFITEASETKAGLVHQDGLVSSHSVNKNKNGRRAAVTLRPGDDMLPEPTLNKSAAAPECHWAESPHHFLYPHVEQIVQAGH